MRSKHLIGGSFRIPPRHVRMPGPWRLVRKKGKRDGYTIVGRHDFDICHLSADRYPEALLLSKAPELLEAIRHVVRQAECLKQLLDEAAPRRRKKEGKLQKS